MPGCNEKAPRLPSLQANCLVERARHGAGLADRGLAELEQVARGPQHGAADVPVVAVPREEKAHVLVHEGPNCGVGEGGGGGDDWCGVQVFHGRSEPLGLVRGPQPLQLQVYDHDFARARVEEVDHLAKDEEEVLPQVDVAGGPSSGLGVPITAEVEVSSPEAQLFGDRQRLCLGPARNEGPEGLALGLRRAQDPRIEVVRELRAAVALQMVRPRVVGTREDNVQQRAVAEVAEPLPHPFRGFVHAHAHFGHVRREHGRYIFRRRGSHTEGRCCNREGKHVRVVGKGAKRGGRGVGLDGNTLRVRHSLRRAGAMALRAVQHFDLDRPSHAFSVASVRMRRGDDRCAPAGPRGRRVAHGRSALADS